MTYLPISDERESELVRQGELQYQMAFYPEMIERFWLDAALDALAGIYPELDEEPISLAKLTNLPQWGDAVEKALTEHWDDYYQEQLDAEFDA